MAYADITRHDRNLFKRFIQRRRLVDSVGLIPVGSQPKVTVDFGAGDGELCKHLVKRFPDARVLCYEPAESLRQQAVENLRGTRNVEIVSREADLPSGQCDLLFCLEVFEHLPPAETAGALESINRVLKDTGVAIIGVPVEVFFPALFKGLFRMTRRYGEFDARVLNILKATVGLPPTDRPDAELEPGVPYYVRHMGFDHRRLCDQLRRTFDIVEVSGSPVRWLGAWFNSEIHYVVRKKGGQASPRFG